MAWLILVLAGLCEIIWAAALKMSQGFTRLWPSVIVFAVGVLSVVLPWSRCETHSDRHGVCGVDGNRRGGNRCGWNFLL